MAYKFLTKKVLERMAKYPLYSQDGKGTDAVVTAKFFYPAGAWTWYVLEYDTEGKDRCYGIVINGHGEGEYGYFSLIALQNVHDRFGLGVERDIHFDPTKVGDINNSYVKKFVNKVWG